METVVFALLGLNFILAGSAFVAARNRLLSLMEDAWRAPLRPQVLMVYRVLIPSSGVVFLVGGTLLLMVAIVGALD